MNNIWKGPEKTGDNLDPRDLDIVIDSFVKQNEEQKKKEEALRIISGIEKQLEGYNLFLSIDETNKKMYIIWESNWNKKLLNIPFSLDDLSSFSSMLEDIKRLLEYDWELQLLGWKEWRAIAYIPSFWPTEWRHRIITKKLPHWQELEYYIKENNKTEELFVFIQSLKWIPEKEWLIDKSIKASWPIWNI